MTKNKYYAIASGRKPGIYDNWPEAQAQVNGYPGAKYKGFLTKREAEAWLKDPVYQTGSRTRTKRGNFSKLLTSPRKGEVTIYTDGGSINNPGPGGYGIVIIYNDERREISGGYRFTTNNRMELMGCIVALRELDVRDKPVFLYSDSSYVVNAINKGWASSWRKNGWLKSDRKQAVNPDLWEKLLDLIDELDISFKWVKGHAGNPFNERCDELAVAAARQEGLPVDAGYNGNC